jgi:hypothetical protein
MKTTFRELHEISGEAASAFCDATAKLNLPFDPDGELNIELKINGVEADFVAIIQAFSLGITERVASLAMGMATNKAWDGFNKLANVLERAKEELEFKTRELFPDAYPYED